MILERQLRHFSVGQRIAAIIVLLLLPMAVLSVVSAVVLNDQEMAFHDSVRESIDTLLPLTTLERYLERARIDELEAQSKESVPNFAALTEDIDQTFLNVESSGNNPDLIPIENSVTQAQRAWLAARPSVRRLIEQVKPLQLQDQENGISDTLVRKNLQQAIQDIDLARQHLADAVRARYMHAAAARRSQLMWLIWSWVITLSVATVLIGAFLHSVLRPIKALGLAARRLGRGEVDVRAPVNGRDELAAVAERFNEMAAYWEATRQTLLTEATADPLTGLLNRRAILSTLETELAAHARRQQPISVFIIDLDRFKAINDRFGHSAGDRALVWIAAQMRDNLRENDRLGRYGGDEFLAILPHTHKNEAQQIAQRMSVSIHESAAKETAYPTVSIGNASAPEDGWRAAALIETADAMLYDVKSKRQQRRVQLGLKVY